MQKRKKRTPDRVVGIAGPAIRAESLIETAGNPFGSRQTPLACRATALSCAALTTDPRVDPRDRLRLFIALALPAPIVDRIVDWQRQALAGTDIRVLSRDHLHITLVFLGSRPAADLDVIGRVIEGGVASARRPAFQPYRYRETGRVGMIELREDAVGGEHYAGRANMLTGHLMLELESRGMYRREYRGWTPHVTVSRFRVPPRLSVDPPDLGSFSPSQVVLFRSLATPAGSVYERLGEWEVGG